MYSSTQGRIRRAGLGAHAHLYFLYESERNIMFVFFHITCRLVEVIALDLHYFGNGLELSKGPQRSSLSP